MGKKPNKLVFEEKLPLWEDRKRTIFGLPLSFTRYSLNDDRIIISQGFLNIVDDEIMLFRILDFQVKLSFWQRIFRVGTVIITSSDITHKQMVLKSIKQPREVKELISEMVMKQRKRHGVRGYDKIGEVPSDLIEDIN